MMVQQENEITNDFREKRSGNGSYHTQEIANTGEYNHTSHPFHDGRLCVGCGM